MIIPDIIMISPTNGTANVCHPYQIPLRQGSESMSGVVWDHAAKSAGSGYHLTWPSNPDLTAMIEYGGPFYWANGCKWHK